MRVLIACEFSGVVRRAFRARGHDAWSCDLLPSEDRSPYHAQCDALHILSSGYGLKANGTHELKKDSLPWELIIAHPPCTYLCNSGVRWLARGGIIDVSRHALMKQACDLFAELYWPTAPESP